MTDDPALPSPPSAEEEALWRKRFGLFALCRLSGLGMMAGGVAVTFTNVARLGGSPVVGALIAAAGLIDAVVLPLVLRRQWEKM